MTTPGRELPLARSGCSLTDSALAEQLDRYRRLGTMAHRITEHDLSVVVWFDPDVDLAWLEETIAIERGCCAFFTLDYDASERRLSITVDDPGRLGAVGVLVSALRGAQPHRVQRADRGSAWPPPGTRSPSTTPEAGSP